MFIIVYRMHNQLNLDTRYIGPFATYAEADDALAALPALGQHIGSSPDGAVNNPGVKFIQELESWAQPESGAVYPASAKYKALFLASGQMGARSGLYDVPDTVFDAACAKHTPEQLTAAEQWVASLNDDEVQGFAQGDSDQPVASAVLNYVWEELFEGRS